MSERLGDYGPKSIDFSNIQHGKLYQLKAANFSTDWESGHVDDWDLELIETEEL